MTDVPKGALTDEDLRNLLRGIVSREGSQKAAAGALGLSPQYMGELLGGTRKITDEVAAKLGHKRLTLWVMV